MPKIQNELQIASDVPIRHDGMSNAYTDQEMTVYFNEVYYCLKESSVVRNGLIRTVKILLSRVRSPPLRPTEALRARGYTKRGVDDELT